MTTPLDDLTLKIATMIAIDDAAIKGLERIVDLLNVMVDEVPASAHRLREVAEVIDDVLARRVELIKDITR